MKRVHVALVLCPSVVALVVAAASCSDKQEGSASKPTSKYYAGKDGGGSPEASIPDVAGLLGPELDPDATAGLMEMQKEVKTIPQALSALLTSYDIEEKEANLGKANGTTPPMQAYSADLLEGVKASRTRLKRLAAAKDITPRSTNLNDRLRFESQAAQMNLGGIFKNMFNSAFMNRRVEAEKAMLRLVENQLEPVMSEDDAFKDEISTIHGEVEKRLSRAETVKTGLTDGIGGLDDGMFEDIEPPEGPQPPQGPQAPAEDPPKDGGP